jgi:hypothetical protein
MWVTASSSGNRYSEHLEETKQNECSSCRLRVQTGQNPHNNENQIPSPTPRPHIGLIGQPGSAEIVAKLRPWIPATPPEDYKNNKTADD